MRRTWTIIGVADVARSFKWYQSLFGQPETTPAHVDFGQIVDTERLNPGVSVGGRMSKIKELSLCLAIILLGALFGGSLYDSIVMAPNYRAGIPQSLEHVRQFMAAANPGSFFRVISPLTQLSILISLILGWKRPAGRRRWLIPALLLIVAGDVFTFTFHYPRNAILFRDPMHMPPELLERAASEWAYGNYLRILLVGSALICAIRALLLGGRSQDA